MITYTKGNVLAVDTEAVVNTVNTVGVMGKGIALMFKEQFPANYREYVFACKNNQVETGKMFVTERSDLIGPKWIINFPTKQHWRNNSKMEWIVEGLEDLHKVLVEHHITSIAIPPLGAGNGKLDWVIVKKQIELALSDLDDVDIRVCEPIEKYQNVAKRKGVTKLTPSRALIAELVRRYWILGMECSLLEIQKLAWFLENAIERLSIDNPLKLEFSANIYGPYANKLNHLLDALDGSYLNCDKRIADADPLDVIWFNDNRNTDLQTYLKSDQAKPYLDALKHTSIIIDGFESPFGLELLATIDWLIKKEGCKLEVEGIKKGMRKWPGGKTAADRKVRLFDSRAITIALKQLAQVDKCNQLTR